MDKCIWKTCIIKINKHLYGASWLIENEIAKQQSFFSSSFLLAYSSHDNKLFSWQQTREVLTKKKLIDNFELLLMSFCFYIVDVTCCWCHCRCRFFDIRSVIFFLSFSHKLFSWLKCLFRYSNSSTSLVMCVMDMNDIEGTRRGVEHVVLELWYCQFFNNSKIKCKPKLIALMLLLYSCLLTRPDQ